MAAKISVMFGDLFYLYACWAVIYLFIFFVDPCVRFLIRVLLDQVIYLLIQWIIFAM